MALQALTMQTRKGRAYYRSTNELRDNLLDEIQACEDRAHKLGLHVTGHALNRAKNALGWELAGDIEKAGKASRDERQ